MQNKISEERFLVLEGIVVSLNNELNILKDEVNILKNKIECGGKNIEKNFAFPNMYTNIDVDGITIKNGQLSIKENAEKIEG